MAWSFDGIDDRATAADHPSLTIPAGDWTVAGWCRLPSNAGSQSQYLLSWGGYNIVPSYNLLIYEETHSFANRMEIRVRDNASVIAKIDAGEPKPGILRIWQHVATKMESNVLYLIVDGNTIGTFATSALTSIDRADPWFFGARSDLGADRWFLGDLAEWAKWDRALNAGEIGSLAKGFSPDHYPNGLTWYCPMVRDFVERRSGLTITNVGSTQGFHPRIIYPGA